MTPEGRSRDFIGAALSQGDAGEPGDDDAALAPESGSAEWREAPVPAAQHGQRLDRAVCELVPEFSRSYLQQLIESGCVQLAGREQRKPSTKVRAGEPLRIELRPTPQSQAFQPEPGELAVRHEDAHLLVLAKPAGLVVHPAPGHWSGTLLNRLLAHHAGAALLPRAGIVHRLDKDTSGLMVVAKTRQAMDALVARIAAREVSREYLALAHRPWQGLPERTVDAAVGRDPLQRVRMAVVDLARHAGKPARTDLRLLDGHAEACLLHCRLHTGRTHQIRVHLSHLGHPLLADELYGGRPLAGLERQALHAWRLAFEHPVTGQALSWVEPLPDDMRQALTRLGLSHEGLAPGPGLN